MLHHSKSSAVKFGGVPSDYYLLHEILDHSKLYLPDWRHRSLFHNTFGVHMLEKHIIGPTLKRKSDGVEVCTRTVATEHIMEDLGVLLTPAEFLREMPIRRWMARVDADTKVRLQRMSIAGTGESSHIDETITWYPYPAVKPPQDKMYLCTVENAAGTEVFTRWYTVSQDSWKFQDGDHHPDVHNYQVKFWAHKPIGPDSKNSA